MLGVTVTGRRGARIEKYFPTQYVTKIQFWNVVNVGTHGQPAYAMGCSVTRGLPMDAHRLPIHTRNSWPAHLNPWVLHSCRWLLIWIHGIYAKSNVLMEAGWELTELRVLVCAWLS